MQCGKEKELLGITLCTNVPTTKYIDLATEGKLPYNSVNVTTQYPQYTTPSSVPIIPAHSKLHTQINSVARSTNLTSLIII
jgi:hypothetical protein